MSDSRDPQALIDAAEQAAKTSDYATAERLLREAADLQESGPPALRAELANTLNNLGVVCELTDNPVEAERCFRRAYQIAVEVLDPSHPFVTTSRKNLEDFCAANGKDPFPAEESKPKPKRESRVAEPAADLVTAPPLTDLLADLLPPPAPATPAPPPPSSPAPSAARHNAPAPSLPVPEVTTGSSSRAMTIGLIAVAVFFGLFLARSLFFRDSPTADSAAVTTSSEPAATTKPAPTPVAPPATAPPAPTMPTPSASSRSPEPVARTPEPKPTQPASPKIAPPQAAKPGAAVDKSGIALVSGEVCRSLRTGGGEWRCEAAGASVPAGQLFFYTRVKSARDVVVQHRWYRGNELRKSVDLEVGANPGSGYRTYSRNTVSAGDWRVELRTKGGDVLHEERFSVR